MKRLFLLLIFIGNISLAQITELPNGKVGIGTTNPGALLDIYSNISTDHWISRMNTNGSNWSGFWEASDNVYLILRDNTGNTDVYLRPNSSSYFNGGNVGIGTTNPYEKLDVNGLIKIPQASSEENNSPGIVLISNDDFLYDGKYLNHYGFGFHDFEDPTNSSIQRPIPYISGYYGLDFFSGGQNRIRVNSSGNVGIGTTTPDAKLAVNGNIHTKEVKVDLIGWSDFVFNSDYNLPTLKEVEQHIKDKGHLQDIPSAEEVSENGILLGEMDSKLLQKIEELTLYAIEQQKQIDVLLSRINQLEKSKNK